ncbi:Aspartyl-tRNA synthetase @ Aspartyl-tRNA(Asn) synthetase [hydrothermal vent metagenome]|uniref:Aspartyl-tRNA synthetase @ Aspartyl-tRNA(Asn) synthetase n=1 Tax=hydrothermal vent metagenome TaxID=652676 RepID=A0A3B0QT22_9ZZZZ
MDNLGDWRRSTWCGSVTERNIGSELTLMGWVQRRRDHGGLIFIDLRDREGIVQLVFNPDSEPVAGDGQDVHALAHTLRSEFVLAVKGVVSKRPEETENPSLGTGMVEIKVSQLKVLSSANALPFQIDDDTDAGEDVRLRHRFLDLRRPLLQRNMMLRHKVSMAARNYLSDNGFLDIETPMLTKSTPEGARDFLVPSRMNAGHFYALPQSPQLFKQILMISGFDRYFQITRCFRDEDLRADRQPEFTQIDAEMSFVGTEDVMGCMEGLIGHVFKEAMGIELDTSFARLTYDDAVGRFGLDAPDVRFGMELKDITGLVKDCGLKVFSSVAKGGGIIKVITAEGAASFTRKELDGLTELAMTYGAKGLAWVKINADGWQSPIAKFFSDEEKQAIEEGAGAKVGDLMLFAADNATVANTVLGRVRLAIGKKLGLIPDKAPSTKEGFNFVWVTDFPMFDYDEKDKCYNAVHHPFTSPRDEDLELLETDPSKVYSKAYDLVLNGQEIGGGSIRIHDSEVQTKVFELLGIGKDEASSKFGFLLDALSYGTPPHGGIAFGLDRILSIMTGSESIRDVIAFPKTQKAYCMMSEAPSEIDGKQLEDLFLRVTKPVQA